MAHSQTAINMKKVNGYDGCFQATFELDVETLADVLNEWQERYGSLVWEGSSEATGHDGWTSP